LLKPIQRGLILFCRFLTDEISSKKKGPFFKIVDNDTSQRRICIRGDPACRRKGKISVAPHEKVPVAMLQSGSRRPPLPKLRRAIALKPVNEYGLSLAETARRLGISTSGVAQILRRSEGV
jgi:hypothetical protein